MDELNVQFFVGITYNFGAKKNYFSGTAGVGVSKKMNFVEPGVNLAVNFYNGGLGALPDKNSMYYDAVLTGKLTAGAGKGNPMDIYPLHVDSGTGLTDRYKYSATVGTNLIFNNHGRNQQVGFVQLRAQNFSFQTYNDFQIGKKVGLTDGYDRWWTGGGNFTFGSKNSPYQMVIASDVFTADTDVQPRSSHFENGKKISSDEMKLDQFEKSIPLPKGEGDLMYRLFDHKTNLASELTQDYLDEYRGGTSWKAEAHSFDLNQGRTSFRLRTPEGQFGVNGYGGSHMWSQNAIHIPMNFHIIPSTRENHWEVQMGPRTGKGF
ncbi:polymorphic toxin type 23 domain-containing protein [Flavobacterium sp. '19STA2R22 D10 B1']|uniref:polymorphic toxin type 23 domain-containing protein n=1 Tax=Flavobacterium aerium TaxID=3037261 RepID=UPI00278C27A3|nr:polymorphic toxin type 23 domain-containing protein [Flavobacterium sp. '19STA2R22 D10 B1']